jgi:hypothetical protein
VPVDVSVRISIGGSIARSIGGSVRIPIGRSIRNSARGPIDNSPIGEIGIEDTELLWRLENYLGLSVFYMVVAWVGRTCALTPPIPNEFTLILSARPSGHCSASTGT